MAPSFFSTTRGAEEMTQIRKKLALRWCLLFFLFAAYSFAGDLLTLITPEEAAQPDAPVPRGIKTRTEGNGPQIKVYSPNLDEPLRVPFIMDISFEASSDKIIDFDTLSVKYLKLIPDRSNRKDKTLFEQQ